MSEHVANQFIADLPEDARSSGFQPGVVALPVPVVVPDPQPDEEAKTPVRALACKRPMANPPEAAVCGGVVVGLAGDSFHGAKCRTRIASRAG